MLGLPCPVLGPFILLRKSEFSLCGIGDELTLDLLLSLPAADGDR